MHYWKKHPTEKKLDIQESQMMLVKVVVNMLSIVPINHSTRIKPLILKISPEN